MDEMTHRKCYPVAWHLTHRMGLITAIFINDKDRSRQQKPSPSCEASCEGQDQPGPRFPGGWRGENPGCQKKIAVCSSLPAWLSALLLWWPQWARKP
jgi:hypothetical protein